MTKAILMIVCIVVLGCTVAACGNVDTASSPDSSYQTASSEPTMNDVLEENRATTEQMCALHANLVDQGWSSDQIYDELNAAGAFDDYNGAGRTFFDAFVKWCYQNS